ncbi:acyloxyacyl hydrolase [Guaruba guarouba]
MPIAARLLIPRMRGSRQTSLNLFCILWLPLLLKAASASPFLHGNDPPPSSLPSGLYKGHTCIGCVLVVSVIEQLAQWHNSTVKAAMERLCSYIPEKLQGFCYILAELYGPHIAELIDREMNADVVCHSLKLCKQDPGQPLCHLYSPPKVGLSTAIRKARRIMKISKDLKNFMGFSSVCAFPLLANLCEKIKYVLRNKLPFEDFDGDKFSTFPTLRGYHWRGRDCDDRNSTVYPGRRPDNWDEERDSNCNGIWGVDPKDGIPYEKKFCKGADSQGVVLLGDSAGAHFHIPPEWMTVSQMSAVRNDTWGAINHDAAGCPLLSPLCRRLPKGNKSKIFIYSFINLNLFIMYKLLIYNLHICHFCTGFYVTISCLSFPSRGCSSENQKAVPPLARHLCNWVREEFGFSGLVLCQGHKPGHLPSYTGPKETRAVCLVTPVFWGSLNKYICRCLRVIQGGGQIDRHCPPSLVKASCLSTGPYRRRIWMFSGEQYLFHSVSSYRADGDANKADGDDDSGNNTSSRVMEYPVGILLFCRNNDTLASMTTPKEMLSNVMQALQYLDTRLPNGSHVILTGLVDGRFLWDNLHDRYHPLGHLNRDITYSQLYSFLDCLQMSPCRGWMTPNETLRNLTSERALQLSNVLKEIARSEKFANFDIFYMDFPLRQTAEKWRRMGGEPWQLIEPVDGFHPSQIAAALGTSITWQKALQEWPQVLGKENPFNDEIEAIFKDQGGH